ncbi:hypothetical protein K440DRAFT_665500 [Wilcoxina mikolae CBS 423.85]|nr:hypothetical protein K440DRAFT_665500 [Wilcoxina mikolae CBS 423.85]
MHRLEPSSFEYGKLHSWVTAKITAAEALAMFEITAHKSSAATYMTSTFSDTTSPMTLTVPTAPTVQPTASITSGNVTTQMSPTTPVAPTTIRTTLTAPITPMVPMASPTDVTSSACTSSMASAPPAHNHMARQGTFRAGPRVLLGIIHVKPPQGQNICRYHYMQPEPISPHRTESTVMCRSAELPMAPAVHDYRTIREYARARAPILSAPAPESTLLPPSPVPALSPPSQPALLQTPPSARLLRTSVPLLSPEQLIQLMREVTEHFAQTWWYEVVQEPPLPSAPLSHTSVLLLSPEQLTQLVREATENFAQPRSRQTVYPSPAS